MHTIIKQSHLLLTKYLNHHIELILMEKTQSSTTDQIFKPSYKTDSYGKKNSITVGNL